MAQTHDEPSQVAAELGDVLVDGPGGVAVALVPDAADETAHRLIEGAAHAQGQRLSGATRPT